MSAVTKPLHLSLYIEPGDAVDDDVVPEGTKSAEAVTLGALVMAVLPVTVPPLLSLVKDWLERSKDRKVKIKTEVKGRPVELEYSGALSQGELETLRVLLMDQ
jgi:hypothetical protein